MYGEKGKIGGQILNLPPLAQQVRSLQIKHDYQA